MKLLFNLEVVEGNRIKARPSDYLKSLTLQEQRVAVTEFLEWVEQQARDSDDPKIRAEAEIGIATAREYLDKLPPDIFTGDEQGDETWARDTTRPTRNGRRN